MNRPAQNVAIAVAALFASSLSAQANLRPLARAPLPPPAPRALPTTAPPVDHPGWAAQPAMDCDEDQAPAETSQAADVADAMAGPDPVVRRARKFREKRVVGSDLKTAVDRVLDSLPWHEDLLDARAEAAATGKPVFWLNALGDIDGFA